MAENENNKGCWIWLQEARNNPDSHVFFRNSFTLSEMPGTAELQISARTFFHAYINGRHVAYGPTPSPDTAAYSMVLDIGYLLETGINVIAVHAHNTMVTRRTRRRQWSGFWCQLTIDNTSVIKTDDTWQCQLPACFAGKPLRRSRAEAFVEVADLRRFPDDWQATEIFNPAWGPPDICYSTGSVNETLRPQEAPEFTSTFTAYDKVVRRGNCQTAAAASEVCFDKMSDHGGEGTYAARTYFYSETDQNISAMLFCDNSYRLTVNNKCVKEQGVPELRNGMDTAHHLPLGFGQCRIKSPEVTLPLEQGWNRIILFQYAEYDQGPCTFIFPDWTPDALTMHQEPDSDSSEGWIVYGPLRTPLDFANHFVELDPDSTPSAPVVPSSEPMTDVSANLWRYSFQPESGCNTEASSYFTFAQDEYIVLDMGSMQHGCAEVSFDGDEGDAVDVVTQNALGPAETALFPTRNGIRQVETLILGESPNKWTFTAPRGFRYIMFVFRRVARQIHLSAAGVRFLDFSPATETGVFRSPDPLLNSAWQMSLETLRTCNQGHFYPAPDKELTQNLSAGMVQSWLGELTMGQWDLSKRVLTDYTLTQLETGHISALITGDELEYYLDEALCLPLWLQRHFMYTGDQEFLNHILPVLEHLYNLFASLTSRDSDMLPVTSSFPTKNMFAGTAFHTGDIPVALNALYCRSLLCGAWLCEQTSWPEKKNADLWRGRAARIAAQLRAVAWHEQKGLFAEAVRRDAPLNLYSWETNILAIYGGIARAQDYDAILSRIFQEKAPYTPALSGGKMTPMLMFFTLETAFALGYREWALNLMMHYYSPLCAQNSAFTTWPEAMSGISSAKDGDIATSMCYGPAALPAGVLLTELAGIRPAAPGFTRVFFEPILTYDQCDWVGAHIPTVHGGINLHWSIDEQKHIDVALDAGFPLEVVPNLHPDILQEATFRVSDDVKIITPGNAE